MNLVTGDYSHFSLDNSMISALVFSDESNLDVDMVLTNIKRWQAYTSEYLEKKVNENLSVYLEQELGQMAAALGNYFPWESKDIVVGGSELRFPGGSSTSRFKAKGKKSGLLLKEIRVGGDFFALSEVPNLLRVMGFFPRELRIELSSAIDPLLVADTLRTYSWSIALQLPHLVEANLRSFTLKVECDSVSLAGFTFDELFSKEKTSIFSSIFGLFRATT